MLFQLIALFVIVMLALAFPGIDAPWLRRASRAYNRLARRKVLSISLVAAGGFFIPAAMSLLVQFPVPAIHDEFAYLLGADTFAHGRLTNETHPMWEHFETFHVIHQPTYQSKYPPGQSLILALGQVIWHPVLGVWLTMALAAGATCWMMYGWVPPRWALLGGLLVLLNWELMRWWGQIYWGGGLAMAGGALLYGALPRLWKAPRVSTSITMAVGIGILANTRPYEGLIASLVAALALLFWMFGKNRPPVKDLALKFILPTTAVLVAVGCWMGYYNYRVTGDALKMPYQVWSDTYGYGAFSKLLFRSSETHDINRELPIPRNEDYEVAAAAKREHWSNHSCIRLLRLVIFFVPGLLWPALLFVPSVIKRDRVVWVFLGATMILLSVAFQNTSAHIHYAGPVGGLLCLITVQCLRQLRLLQIRGESFGRGVVQFVPLGLVACLIGSFCQFALPSVPTGWAFERVRLEQELLAEAGKDLVFIRYGSSHILHNEWVYNLASVDLQEIVWARELSPEQNLKLIEHFNDRKVWLLEPDVSPPRLTPHNR